jgi:hypothetical protein
MVIISWLVGVMLGCSGGCEMRRMERRWRLNVGFAYDGVRATVTPVERFSLQHNTRSSG